MAVRFMRMPIVLLALMWLAGASHGAESDRGVLPRMQCIAEQTGGFHDYPNGGEAYEPALFHPRPFSLEENIVFMLNLAEEEGAPDLYLTFSSVAEDGTLEETELECRRVRGTGDARGYSCVNLPPSEMLLINALSLRFTRTAVGGWTFAGANDRSNGDSIFVEYGQCTPIAITEDSAKPPADKKP